MLVVPFVLSHEVVVPIVVACLSAGGLWLKDLTVSGRRHRTIREANERLKFWKTLLGCPGLDDIQRDSAIRELQKVAEHTRALYAGHSPGRWEAVDYARYYKRVNIVRKLLLLIRLPTQSAVRDRRWAYVSLWALFYWTSFLLEGQHSRWWFAMLFTMFPGMLAYWIGCYKQARRFTSTS